MSEFYRQASHRESMDADEQKEKPAQDQMSAREFAREIVELATDMTIADPVGKIETKLEAFARSQGKERGNG